MLLGRRRRAQLMRTLVFIAATSALIAAACALVGCGGGPMQPPPGNAMLALGTAATDGSGFVALGGDATLVPGAQGGFHVWLKYRIEGMAPEKVNVHRESRRVSDDALVLLADGSARRRRARRRRLVAAADGAAVVHVPDADRHQRHRPAHGLRRHAHRPSTARRWRSSSAEATVHCPDGAQAAFCAKICSG